MTDKCSYYLHSMSQLVQCELGELTWHSALRVLACRKFVCYNSILKAESSISSVCELFLSLIIAQLSPSQVYLTPCSQLWPPCVPPPSLPPLHASRFFIPNNLCTDPQVENTLHFHSPRAWDSMMGNIWQIYQEAPQSEKTCTFFKINSRICVSYQHETCLVHWFMSQRYYRLELQVLLYEQTVLS